MRRLDLPKPHHDSALDWVRFVAALAVLGHHVTPLVAHRSLFPHAYLAVDLFFVLSGYVVAKRYQQRLAQGMTSRAFVAARASRLAPLLFLAGAVCTLEVSMRTAFGSTLVNTPSWKIAAAAVASWFALPSASAPALGHGNWPLDPPLWSLFFELAVGVLAAPWLLRARSGFLLCLVGLAAAILLRTINEDGLNAGVFLRDFPIALARMVFSFCLGVLIWRRSAASPMRAVTSLFWLKLVGLVGICLGYFGASANTWGAYTVTLLWPAILYAIISRPSTLRVPPASWLGEMSYSIYVLHWPLIFLVRNVARHAGVLRVDSWLTTIALVAFVLASCAAAVQLYERPLRERLRKLAAISVDLNSDSGRR